MVKWFYKELTSWIRKTAIVIKVPTELLDWLVCGIKPEVKFREFDSEKEKWRTKEKIEIWRLKNLLTDQNNVYNEPIRNYNILI